MRTSTWLAKILEALPKKALNQPTSPTQKPGLKRRILFRELVTSYILLTFMRVETNGMKDYRRTKNAYPVIHRGRVEIYHSVRRLPSHHAHTEAMDIRPYRPCLPYDVAQSYISPDEACSEADRQAE